MRDHYRDQRIKDLGSDLWSFVFNMLDRELDLCSSSQAGAIASGAERSFRAYLSDRDHTYDLGDRSRELAGSWINGNLSDTIEALQNEIPIVACSLALRIAFELPAGDRNLFFNKLRERSFELLREHKLCDRSELSKRYGIEGEGEA